MWKRLANLTIWAYPEETTVETLQRHRTIALRVVYIEGFFCMLMMTTLTESMLTQQRGTVSLAIIVISALISLALGLPALLCIAWADEVEKTLARKGAPVEKPFGIQIAWFAMKMCFWAIVLVLGLHLMKRWAS